MKPRISPVTDPEPELADLLAKTQVREGSPLNIFTTLANHPRLLKRFNVLGGFFLGRGLLPERERELVILRTAWRAGSEYEFGQHTLIGASAGLTAAEIRAIASEGGQWSDRDATLLAVADEVESSAVIDDRTWDRLKGFYSDAEVIEVIMLAGFYRMLAGFLNSTRVELDGGVPGWP